MFRRLFLKNFTEFFIKSFHIVNMLFCFFLSLIFLLAVHLKIDNIGLKIIFCCIFVEFESWMIFAIGLFLDLIVLLLFFYVDLIGVQEIIQKLVFGFNEGIWFTLFDFMFNEPSLSLFFCSSYIIRVVVIVSGYLTL